MKIANYVFRAPFLAVAPKPDSTLVRPSNGQAVRFGLSMQAFKRMARATQWSVGFQKFLDVLKPGGTHSDAF